MSKFANIFWHYYSGPLIGLRQRFWPLEKQYSPLFKLAAVVLWSLQASLFCMSSTPTPVRLGLALILLSPQWFYCVSPVPHLVFEFRGYSMAAGVALIAAWLLSTHGVLLVTLFVFFAWRSLVRRRILVSPLAFWQKVQEENKHHGT